MMHQPRLILPSKPLAASRKHRAIMTQSSHPAIPITSLLLILLTLILLPACAYQAKQSDVNQTALTPDMTHEAAAPVRQEAEVWIIARTPGQSEAPAADHHIDEAALVRTSGDDAGQALPLAAATVRANIRGLTCDVALTQRFTNPHTRTIDAAYRFPLPADARVREFVMVIGERRIRGIFRSPDEAQRLYASAKQQGYRASLITLGDDHVLTHRVANIAPGRAIDIDLTFRHTLEQHDGGYRFTLPRLAGAAGVERAAVDLTIDLRPGVPITGLKSFSHRIEREPLDASSMRVTLADDDITAFDQPFDLRFRVADGERLARAADHDELGHSTTHDAAIAIDASRPTDR
jgi:hypothetical protein